MPFPPAAAPMNPQTRIAHPNGGYVFGSIPHIAAPVTGQTLCHAGDIHLQYGKHLHKTRGFGLIHITKSHEADIWKAYRGMAVIDFVCAVASGYRTIVLQADRSLALLKHNGATKILTLNPAIIDGVHLYHVGTGYPLARVPNWEKRQARIIL